MVNKIELSMHARNFGSKKIIHTYIHVYFHPFM